MRQTIVAITLVVSAWSPFAPATNVVLLASDPRQGERCATPPEKVSLQYNETLDGDGSTLMVLDSAGHRVDDGGGGINQYDSEHMSMSVDVSRVLTTGRYTVQWTAVSRADGDITRGEYDFLVIDSRLTQQSLIVPSRQAAIPP